ncbi:hypothetical protein F5887DRAFT_1178304 [Amanita rubescens]|nr:hypothetical protein F5887DRAFT_1178304 [Amanita rubescens]
MLDGPKPSRNPSRTSSSAARSLLSYQDSFEFAVDDDGSDKIHYDDGPDKESIASFSLEFIRHKASSALFFAKFEEEKRRMDSSSRIIIGCQVRRGKCGDVIQLYTTIRVMESLSFQLPTPGSAGWPEKTNLEEDLYMPVPLSGSLEEWRFTMPSNTAINTLEKQPLSGVGPLSQRVLGASQHLSSLRSVHMTVITAQGRGTGFNDIIIHGCNSVIVALWIVLTT